MHPDNRSQLEQRIVEAAEAALRHQKYVSSIDVLVGIGWLPPSTLATWRQGRLPYLERGMTANLHKLSTAMHLFRSWAVRRGLKSSETAYVARTRDRRLLRFSASGQEAVERAYRTHWVSPALSEGKRERLAQRHSRPPDLVAISPRHEWTCSLCGDTGGGHLLMQESGPICMTCAKLDRLVFLSSGNAPLTRRAKKASQLSAVVVRWSRTRKRYERQGILVEESALERAEAELAPTR
jgi:hypothetical protein